MHRVQLIFRKTNPLFFSIEKVFASVLGELQKRFSVECRYMPFHSASVSGMARNIAFARKSKADIYHVTGDVHYVVLGLPAEKTILTIHDSVFIRANKGLKKIFFQWVFLRLPVKKCRFVTTISEKSKTEILKYTGCNPDKVIVIPNPVDDHIYYRQKAFDAQNPVLLFIGSTPNKNLDRIIAAIAGLRCILDIVGRIPEEHLLLLKLHEIRFRQYAGLSEAEMADRYAACDIVVFPSLYEGFGLPILEAQKAGRPILTSNLSPMKEAAGAGACLVDPLDPHSIREGINRIMEADGYREHVVARGFDNIRKYDRELIAAQYLKLYEVILNT